MRAMRCCIWAAASCSARRRTRAATSLTWSSPSRAAAWFLQLRDQFDWAADTPMVADDAGVAAGGENAGLMPAAAFDATVIEIRDLDRIATLPDPPAPDRFIRQAENIPAVVIKVSRYRSDDAILLTPAGITSVPLQGLTRSARRTLAVILLSSSCE